MNALITGIIGAIFTHFYFETYKSYHEKIHGPEKPVDYLRALFVLVPISLILGLACLGAYFLYKKFFL